MFAAVRTLDPVGIKLRYSDLLRHRGEYVIPGPNYLWSMDGYDKLKAYGLEVYAYVGITNRTGVSVLRQYLDILQRENTQPQIIRTDRGSETTMMANAHYQLMQKQLPDISFEECYYYGTSTANQRIEAWWGQLTKSSMFRWRVSHRFRTFSMTSVNTLQTYFSMLQEDKLYDSHMLSDCIAFLAIYTPIIRREIFGFVRLWNVHRNTHPQINLSRK